MDELPSERDIDLHAVRHGLKLKRDTGTTTLFENRAGFACPACDREFATIYVSEDRHSSFQPSGPTDFCIIREADRILLMTHE